VFVRCLAQTIDPDDFVHVWGMQRWMSLYEHMCNDFVTGVLATSEEMVAHMRIAGWRAPIYNVSGLAFGKQEVQERVESITPFEQRPMRVGFAARWDQEKQPGFFMDLIEQWHREAPYPVEFAIYQGGELRSNNPEYVTRARQMAQQGQLRIYEYLSKNQYYFHLNHTRVLFNCALQDWVSNTVSEADALGANVLYPAYRSFPEVFANDADRMYVPWSSKDAIDKLDRLLRNAHPNQGQISDWTDGTIDRIVDIMETAGTIAEGGMECRAQQWARNSNRYRDYTAQNKYRRER
jgi:hypothetical protein